MKTILLAVAAIFGLLQSLYAFTPAGPVGNGGDAWQVQNIGYGPPTDDVGPKNIGEEYRRNTPVMYYAYDATFLDYFGSNGVAAVQGAFNIMNNVFTNNPTGMTNGLDGYSTSLSEIPLETRHVNYQAQALGLYDLKTYTLNILVRQMGLADPVEYTWTLHDRAIIPSTTCPSGMVYSVVQRNFDTGGSPVANSQSVLSLYSPYVNGVLYSYYIVEVCTGPPVLAITVPFPVDPLDVTYSPVASQLDNVFWGNFYTGLTRDDVMGLRYLMTTNTINTETAATGSVLMNSTTNTSQEVLFPANTNILQGFGTFSLSTLLTFASTNPPATVETAFPGINVNNVSNYFVLVTNWTVFSYITNIIGAAAGSESVVVGSNATVQFEEVYVDTFPNIVTNHYYPNTTVTLQTITVGPPASGSAAGSPNVTNVTSKTVTLAGQPSGDYYIVPTNNCGLDLNSTPFYSSVVLTTNLITSTTNSATATNSLSYTLNEVTQYTNYVYEGHPVTCSEVTNATGLYEGIEKINFVFASFDSDAGEFFAPITNDYTMVVITNSQPHVQQFQRIVTEPDFLFQASDQADGNGAYPVLVSIEDVSVPNFDTANVLPGLAGPGTINPQTTVAFEKTGPVYFNDFFDLTGTNYWAETPTTDDDLFYGLYFVWGSFDGTTNAPVVYPDGATLDSLGNLVMIQISPTSVPNGTNGVAYSPTTFTTSGGSFTPPYSWSADGLPGGLNVSTGGTLYGTPTNAGSFVFTLTMTDTNARTAQWNYPLTITQ
jgi:hypothetical protein